MFRFSYADPRSDCPLLLRFLCDKVPVAGTVGLSPLYTAGHESYDAFQALRVDWQVARELWPDCTVRDVRRILHAERPQPQVFRFQRRHEFPDHTT